MDAFLKEKLNHHCKSLLNECDCKILFHTTSSFENFDDYDLDFLYRVAFGRWAYHLTRKGYIDAISNYSKSLIEKSSQIMKEFTPDSIFENNGKPSKVDWNAKD